jgi:hypothetical protein
MKQHINATLGDTCIAEVIIKGVLQNHTKFLPYIAFLLFRACVLPHKISYLERVEYNGSKNQ